MSKSISLTIAIYNVNRVAQSVVSVYGLDDRAIEVRSLAEAKDFFSNLCVQTGSEAHPASCAMGTGGPFPGAEANVGVNIPASYSGSTGFISRPGDRLS
jgi:hypothetical protein